MRDRRGIVLRQFVTPEKADRAQQLRRVPTPAEKLLWRGLRAGRLGFHFRRQQVIDGFIADFYCHAVGLVVEVDGNVHRHQKDYDAERTRLFNERDLIVLRFRNEQDLQSLSEVLHQIVLTCEARQREQQSPT